MTWIADWLRDFLTPIIRQVFRDLLAEQPEGIKPTPEAPRIAANPERIELLQETQLPPPTQTAQASVVRLETTVGGTVSRETQMDLPAIAVRAGTVRTPRVPKGPAPDPRELIREARRLPHNSRRRAKKRHRSLKKYEHLYVLLASGISVAQAAISCNLSEASVYRLINERKKRYGTYPGEYNISIEPISPARGRYPQYCLFHMPACDVNGLGRETPDLGGMFYFTFRLDDVVHRTPLGTTDPEVAFDMVRKIMETEQRDESAFSLGDWIIVPNMPGSTKKERIGAFMGTEVILGRRGRTRVVGRECLLAAVYADANFSL